MSILNHRQPQWKKFNLKAKAAKMKVPKTEAFVKLTSLDAREIFVRPSQIVALRPGLARIGQYFAQKEHGAATYVTVGDHQDEICVVESPTQIMLLIGAIP